MGLRFRKRIGLGPFRVNLSRRGAGLSFGVPGARVTKSATGRSYVTFGIPGTGLSWSKEIGGRRMSSRDVGDNDTVDSRQVAASESQGARAIKEEPRPLAPLEFD